MDGNSSQLDNEDLEIGNFRFARKYTGELVKISSGDWMLGFVVLDTKTGVYRQIRVLDPNNFDRREILPTVWNLLLKEAAKTESNLSSLFPDIQAVGAEDEIDYYVSAFPEGVPINQYLIQQDNQGLPPGIACQLVAEWLENLNDQTLIPPTRYVFSHRSLWLTSDPKPKLIFGEIAPVWDAEAEAGNISAIPELLLTLTGPSHDDTAYQAMLKTIEPSIQTLGSVQLLLADFAKNNKTKRRYWKDDRLPKPFLQTLSPEEYNVNQLHAGSIEDLYTSATDEAKRAKSKATKKAILSRFDRNKSNKNETVETESKESAQPESETKSQRKSLLPKFDRNKSQNLETADTTENASTQDAATTKSAQTKKAILSNFEQTTSAASEKGNTTDEEPSLESKKARSNATKKAILANFDRPDSPDTAQTNKVPSETSPVPRPSATKKAIISSQDRTKPSDLEQIKLASAKENDNKQDSSNQSPTEPNDLEQPKKTEPAKESDQKADTPKTSATKKAIISSQDRTKPSDLEQIKRASAKETENTAKPDDLKPTKKAESVKESDQKADTPKPSTTKKAIISSQDRTKPSDLEQIKRATAKENDRPKPSATKKAIISSQDRTKPSDLEQIKRASTKETDKKPEPAKPKTTQKAILSTEDRTKFNDDKNVPPVKGDKKSQKTKPEVAKKSIISSQDLTKEENTSAKDKSKGAEKAVIPKPSPNKDKRTKPQAATTQKSTETDLKLIAPTAPATTDKEATTPEKTEEKEEKKAVAFAVNKGCIGFAAAFVGLIGLLILFRQSDSLWSRKVEQSISEITDQTSPDTVVETISSAVVPPVMSPPSAEARESVEDIAAVEMLRPDPPEILSPAPQPSETSLHHDYFEHYRNNGIENDNGDTSPASPALNPPTDIPTDVVQINTHHTTPEQNPNHPSAPSDEKLKWDEKLAFSPSIDQFPDGPRNPIDPTAPIIRFLLDKTRTYTTAISNKHTDLKEIDYTDFRVDQSKPNTPPADKLTLDQGLTFSPSVKEGSLSNMAGIPAAKVLPELSQPTLANTSKPPQKKEASVSENSETDDPLLVTAVPIEPPPLGPIERSLAIIRHEAELILSAADISESEKRASFLKLREAIDQSDVSMLYLGGERYLLGKGVPKDIPRGMQMLERATEMGDPRAMVLLATCHLEGWAGEPQYERAIELYEAAVELAYIPAHYPLASIYAFGKGVPTDSKAAANVFEDGAKAGCAECMLEAARGYEHGLGRCKDPCKAIAWYKKAALADNKEAIGWCTRKGICLN